MKGHIRERSPGHWAIVLDVGEIDPKTGKKKRKWHSFTGTKREAQPRRLLSRNSVHEMVSGLLRRMMGKRTMEPKP